MDSPEKRPRLAFVLPAMAAGGMEQVTLATMQALSDQGYAVDLVLERRLGPYLSRVPDSAGLFGLAKGSKWSAYAALIRARPRDGLTQLARMLFHRVNYVPLRRVRSLAAYLREREPDIIFVSHGRMPILALWARAIAGVLSSRLVIIEHSTLSRWLEVFTDEPARHRQWQYRVQLARQFYPQADGIVAVSDGVGDDLARTLALSPRVITTIYNPVVGPDLRAAAQQPFAHPWFADGQPPVLLAVGRLVREKNFSALIEAFAYIRQQRPARLLILGEGEQRPYLEAQIERYGLIDDVAMPGWADNPYVYMRHSAVFVLCSLFEGLGIVLVEAMACGCPVVATDCPSGPREVLDGGRHGLLVPMNDTQALADAIMTRLDTPCDTAALQARAEDFSIEKGAATYRALIDDLLAGKTSMEPVTGLSQR